MLKNIAEGYEKNENWMGGLVGYVLSGVDSFNGMEKVVGAITTQDVQDFMKRLLDQGNYRVVILDPEVVAEYLGISIITRPPGINRAVCCVN